MFNDSKTDPAAWVAKVKKVSKKLIRVSHMVIQQPAWHICAIQVAATSLCDMQVSFPFHDAEDDWAKVSHCIFLHNTACLALLTLKVSCSLSTCGAHVSMTSTQGNGA